MKYAVTTNEYSSDWLTCNLFSVGMDANDRAGATAVHQATIPKKLSCPPASVRHSARCGGPGRTAVFFLYPLRPPGFSLYPRLSVFIRG